MASGLVASDGNDRGELAQRHRENRIGVVGRPAPSALTGISLFRARLRRVTRRRLGAGHAAFQELDLPVVIGFVLGNVEPFPMFVDSVAFVHFRDPEPFVVALLELGLSRSSRLGGG